MITVSIEIECGEAEPYLEPLLNEVGRLKEKLEDWGVAHSVTESRDRRLKTPGGSNAGT